MKIDIKCKYCSKIFPKERGEYNRQLRKYPNFNFFCSKECLKKDRTSPKIKKICKYCDKKFEVIQSRRSRKFCGENCANKYTAENLSDEVRLIKSIKAKKWITDFMKNEPEKFAKICEKGFKVLRNRKNRYFSSKGERELFDNIKSATSLKIQTGGSFKISEDGTRKQLDIFCKETKTIVEYDGICHFKPIYGQESFDKLTRKDKLLKKWCKENGWSLIRIREEIYKKNRISWTKKMLQHIETNDSEYVEYY